MAKGFYTDGMSVNDILALTPAQLNSMSERDMSRALRTVALAANKRLDRLMQQTKIQGGQFVEKKSAKYAIATDALNKLYDEAGKSKKGMRFGVGGKNRNQMYSELMRAKGFMSLKTSTIKGAVAVRKQRESRLFGKTREDVMKQAGKEYAKSYKKQTGKKPTKKQTEEVKKSAFAAFQRQSSSIWARFRRIWEIPNIRSSYGSDEVIDFVAIRTTQGASEQDIIDELTGAAMDKYEEEQDAMNEEANDFFDDDAGIDFFGDDWD